MKTLTDFKRRETALADFLKVNGDTLSFTNEPGMFSDDRADYLVIAPKEDIFLEAIYLGQSDGLAIFQIK